MKGQRDLIPAARAKSEFQGTVLIADDHEILRVGLMELLRRDLNVTRFVEAECFAQAIQQLQREDVTLAIVDLMPDMMGPNGIARMRRLRPQALFVVLSASESREDILQALAAGAHGYIVKNQHKDQLIDKLRHILSGEIYVPPILAELAPEPVGGAVAPHAWEPARPQSVVQPPAAGSQGSG